MSDTVTSRAARTWQALQASVAAARQSLIGASFLIVQPLLLNALSIPVTAFIIAKLGALDYGQWSIALTLIASTTILTNLGLRSAFIRSVAQEPAIAPRAFAEQLGLRILLAVLAGATALGLCFVLGYPRLVGRCTAILAVGGIFTASGAVVSDLLAATERLPALATINTIAGLGLTIASVIAMWFDTGPTGLAVSYLLGPVVTGSLSLFLVQQRLFPVRVSWNLRRYWALLRQARVLGLQLFVMNLGTHAENLLVPKLVGISSYGFFAAGTLLPKRLEAVPDGLNTAFYPVLARGYRSGSDEAIASVKRLGLFMSAACVSAAIATFALAGPIAQLLFRQEPELCRTIIQITIWWIPLIGLAYAMGYALNAAGREADEAKVAIAGTLVSLAMSTALILKFGLIGACVALPAKATVALVFRMPPFLASLRSAGRAPAIPAIETAP